MAIIKATQIRPNYFVGVTTLADIRGNCPDPKRVDQSKERDRKNDTDLARAFSQRGENQRQFNKPRVCRVEKYADYISGIDNNELLGGYPPVTLWTSDDIISFENNTLTIKGESILTANDGETQLAARYMLASNIPTWLDRPFAITITVNSSKEAAMQTLHDMNHFATPVSEKETAALNVQGPLTKAINIGLNASGLDTGELIKSRTEKVTGSYSTTQSILLHGALGARYGEACLDRSPNSLLKKANAQFSNLEGKENVVSGFIGSVIKLPHQILRTITSDHMMALGVRYAVTGVLLTPISDIKYKAIDDRLKIEKGGSRATVSVRAKEIAMELAA